MRTRPTSVNIISWFIIVTSVLSLASGYYSHGNPLVQELMAKNPMPIALQYGMMYGGLALSLVAGIAMRQGHNWARLVYVGWSVIGLVIGLATSPMKSTLIPGAVLFAVIAYFLFRPNTNAYFNPRVAANDA
ncbi:MULTISPECIES: hypothetical protein [unclassified Janthinobacterium]|uniref:hypothetical protein n=1 Tax=unclassified Janthinobacterium TaxID=2610881 RepID=UPI00161702F1|nr:MULTISPECIES: hypothetical protein [unclassified Janthinobacterium]MBB5367052.1 hypothetical protein [Janthinobacterium sp. K2C7]MBB5380470.1 hypothetical protein [Janthinobacterium sp. K2Li3]MBB5385434.1 hypothetical protein [Janthinobacterium sp. K2E3]